MGQGRARSPAAAPPACALGWVSVRCGRGQCFHRRIIAGRALRRLRRGLLRPVLLGRGGVIVGRRWGRLRLQIRLESRQRLFGQLDQCPRPSRGWTRGGTGRRSAFGFEPCQLRAQLLVDALELVGAIPQRLLLATERVRHRADLSRTKQRRNGPPDRGLRTRGAYANRTTRPSTSDAMSDSPRLRCHHSQGRE